MLSLLSPGHLTLLALRPCFLLPCSWLPAPDHPRQPGPAKARLFWKSVGRRQNVRSVSSLQTGAPAPGQTAAVSVCPQRPVFSFQARRSRGQAAVWGMSPTRWAYGGEARTDWVMTSQPPARLGPPTRSRAVRPRTAQGPRFLHLCCHTGHSTGRDGIYTLKNYYLPLAHFPVEAGGVRCCFSLTLQTSIGGIPLGGACAVQGRWPPFWPRTSLCFCVTVRRSLLC